MRRPEIDPVARDMNAWIAERLDLDATQIRASGSRTFITLGPGAYYHVDEAAAVEATDGEVLVIWTGMASLPYAEFMAKRAEIKLQYEGGKHRADQ